MKVRIKFTKTGSMRFIGHLDVMRYFQKAMRRAEIPIAFTEGYSPHMIMSFANPLGIGLSSSGEYFDIELREFISGKEAVTRLNSVMVEGMEVKSFRKIAEERKMTGMAIVAAADYLVTPKEGFAPDAWEESIKAFLEQPEICIVKKTKRSEAQVDIRPLIYQMCLQDRAVWMQIAAGSVQNLKPGLVMEAFCNFSGIQIVENRFIYHRQELYADVGNTKDREFRTLEDMGTEMNMP